MSFAITAVTISAITGVYSAVSSAQAGKAQAALAEQEAELNAEMQRREAEEDAKAENDEVRRLREAQRRRRATIEAGYAKSGVLLEGTPAQLLVNQREADEYNVQATHYEGSERRKRMLWAADNGERLDKFEASSMRRKANAQFISGMGNTVAKTAKGTNKIGADRGWW